MLHLSAVVACFAIGFALVMAFSRRRDPLLACALAIPIGAATSMALAAAFVVLYLPMGAATYGVAWAAVLAWAVWRAWGTRTIRTAAPTPRGRWAWWCAALVLLLAIVAVAAWRWSAAVMEPPSYETLLLGRVVAGGAILPDGALPAGGDHGFALYAPFFLVSPALPLALIPVMGVSGIALVAIATARSIPESRARTLVVAGLVALLATSPALARLFVTVGSPAAAGVMLVAFVVIWRESEDAGDARAVPLALVGLAGFMLFGNANAITACATLPLVAAAGRLPRRSLVAPVGAFLFLEAAYLSVGTAPLVIAPLAAAALWIATSWPRGRRWSAFLPIAAIACLAIALVTVSFARDAEALAALGHATSRHRWWPLAATIVMMTVAGLVRRSVDLRLLAVGAAALAMPILLADGADDKIAAFAGLGASVLLLLLNGVCGAAGAPRSLDEPEPVPVVGEAPHRVLFGRRGLAAAGFTALMTLILFTNLRHLVQGALARKPTHRLTAQSVEPDLRVMSEHATRSVRHKDVLYYLVRDGAPGTIVYLPRELDTHTPYLEAIARLDVRLLPATPSLPAGATDTLSRLARDSVSIARSDGSAVPMLFLFAPGEREYVVARGARSGDPFVWLPVTVFRANGGVL